MNSSIVCDKQLIVGRNSLNHLSVANSSFVIFGLICSFSRNYSIVKVSMRFGYRDVVRILLTLTKIGVEFMFPFFVKANFCRNRVQFDGINIVQGRLI